MLNCLSHAIVDIVAIKLALKFSPPLHSPAVLLATPSQGAVRRR